MFNRNWRKKLLRGLLREVYKFNVTYRIVKRLSDKGRQVVRDLLESGWNVALVFVIKDVEFTYENVCRVKEFALYEPDFVLIQKKEIMLPKNYTFLHHLNSRLGH